MSKPAKIMIVGNIVDTHQVLWEYVQQSQDCLFTTSGGLNALKRLKEINYDVRAVVMDMALDDMDGITLTEQIRRNESIRNCDDPILIFWLNGHTVNQTILEVKVRLKVVEIFTKPIHSIQMIERVKAYITIENKSNSSNIHSSTLN